MGTASRSGTAGPALAEVGAHRLVALDGKLVALDGKLVAGITTRLVEPSEP
jgi:hypothetical protein